MRILQRVATILLVVLTIASALMTFDPVRQYGISLFASAGAAGIILGLAARPVFTNLFAGIQIAMTQPIRVEDQVVVEGESGWIETITSTYVVVRIWDLRRLIVPLSYFIEKPFQNWTYEDSRADRLGVFARRLHSAGGACAAEARRDRARQQIVGRQTCQSAGYRHAAGHGRIARFSQRPQSQPSLGFALRSARKADRVSAVRVPAIVAAAADRSERRRLSGAGCLSCGR